MALLPEDVPLYAGRTSAEVTRLRGYLLAAFADTGLPEPALPYVLEALESGHMPYEVAGAAIALRGLGGPGAGAVPYLLRAVRNLGGADATVSFESYDPRWPYARPTTALTEIRRTLAALGADAAAGPGHCCHDMAAMEPLEAHAAGALDVELEDQDGRPETFDGFFGGRPAVIAFFYTRCDNPYKCSLTVARLAQVQALVRERGLSGAIRLAAITYDPEFDLPKRLRRYGIDRGMTFGDDARFFRTTSGFDELRRRFRLGVNYGASTVNRHQIEVYVLDAEGGLAGSFTRFQWDPAAVLEAAEGLRAAPA